MHWRFQPNHFRQLKIFFQQGEIIGAEKLPDLISELEPPNQGLEIYMDKQERWRGFCHEKVG